MIKKSQLVKSFGEEHTQQPANSKEIVQWLHNLRQRGLMKRKEPQRFIVGATCYQNDDNKRIQIGTFVKIEFKNITLPFCGLQKRQRKKR